MPNHYIKTTDNSQIFTCLQLGGKGLIRGFGHHDLFSGTMQQSQWGTHFGYAESHLHGDK